MKMWLALLAIVILPAAAFAADAQDANGGAANDVAAKADANAANQNAGDGAAKADANAANAAGETDPVADANAAVADADDDDEATTEEKQEVSKEEMAKLIKDLGAKDEATVTAAVEALAKIGKQAVKELSSGFDDCNKATRLAAVRVFEKVHNADARLMLAKRVYGDKYAEVRDAAAKALRPIIRKNEVLYIVKKCFEVRDRDRLKAARAIALLQRPEIIDSLIPTTKNYLKNRKTDERNTLKTNTGGISASGVNSGGTFSMGESDEDPEASTIIVLKVVLGTSYNSDLAELQKWWKDNRAAFVFPKPEDLPEK